MSQNGVCFSNYLWPSAHTGLQRALVIRQVSFWSLRQATYITEVNGLQLCHPRLHFRETSLLTYRYCILLYANKSEETFKQINKICVSLRSKPVLSTWNRIQKWLIATWLQPPQTWQTNILITIRKSEVTKLEKQERKERSGLRIVDFLHAHKHITCTQTHTKKRISLLNHGESFSRHFNGLKNETLIN